MIKLVTTLLVLFKFTSAQIIGCNNQVYSCIANQECVNSMQQAYQCTMNTQNFSNYCNLPNQNFYTTYECLYPCFNKINGIDFFTPFSDLTSCVNKLTINTCRSDLFKCLWDPQCNQYNIQAQSCLQNNTACRLINQNTTDTIQIYNCFSPCLNSTSGVSNKNWITLKQCFDSMGGSYCTNQIEECESNDQCLTAW